MLINRVFAIAALVSYCISLSLPVFYNAQNILLTGVWALEMGFMGSAKLFISLGFGLLANSLGGNLLWLSWWANPVFVSVLVFLLAKSKGENEGLSVLGFFLCILALIPLTIIGSTMTLWENWDTKIKIELLSGGALWIATMVTTGVFACLPSLREWLNDRLAPKQSFEMIVRNAVDQSKKTANATNLATQALVNLSQSYVSSAIKYGRNKKTHFTAFHWVLLAIFTIFVLFYLWTTGFLQIVFRAYL